MSWLDKIGSTILPLPSEEERAEARRKAEGLARDNAWLAMILDAHRQIERHLNEALSATDVDSRLRAAREAARLNAGHSIAEEVTVYPALLDHTGPISGKIHAALAYEEQQMAKIEQAKLETLDPTGEEWRTKMEHLKSAVLQHVYQEESRWFPELAQNISPQERERLSRRYAEEFERCCGSEGKQGQGSAGAQASMAGREPPDVPPVVV